MLLLPALNTMFDISTTRTVAFQSHQPMIIFVMLALAMLACSLLAGFEMGSDRDEAGSTSCASRSS
jgi:hypothetical protein